METQNTNIEVNHLVNEDVVNEDVVNEDVPNEDAANEDVVNEDAVNEDVVNEDVPNEDADEKKNIKKKKVRFFETYISKVLKSITEDNGITVNAKQQLNSAICLLAKYLSVKSRDLVYISKKKTMSIKQVCNAVKLTLCDNFSTAAIAHAEEAVEKFSKVTDKYNSRQDKAGILFPPSVCEKFLRNFDFTKIMITKSSPVYFASILEYITTQILIGSARIAKENGHVRITIRDLEMCIRTNKDLCKLFDTCKINFIGGGVVPEIHQSLLNKKPRKKKIIKTDSEVKKNHRFRPGTICLREIKKFQKTSNCLTFAKYPFERFIRTIISNYNQNMKISKEVFIILQYYIEQFVVDFLRDCNAAAIHSGRVKLMVTDIDFISKLRKYDVSYGL
jgi:histone H3/H4